MTKPKMKIKKEPKIYQLNTEKISKKIGDVAYIFSFIGVTEEHEHFEKIKPYLIIPEEPKTLDEITKELDEKFEELLVKTKMKFDTSKLIAEKKYEYVFDGIITKFKYAVRYGNFPPKLTLYGIDGSVLTSSSNNCISVSSTFPNFEVKPHGNNAGYFTFGTIRVWEKTKPSLWVRTFIKFFFGVNWKDA